ncbi:sensor histidine kinase [Actinomadura sp. CNU-125]|uniref:sensor histidine kinase n=1 Tax=Actinomadura sp. CNU-125 TaxID=1904961 RepID=UPI0021CCFC69|nr:sensor histidine kinase [Actinomadura sp. CNU-125]
MSERKAAGAGRARRGPVVRRARAVFDAVEHLAGGVGTAVLALAALAWIIIVALLCLVGVGLLLARTVPRVVRIVAERERGRLTRWGPDELFGAGRPADRLRPALADPVVRRELRWLLIHGTFGWIVGILGLTFALHAVQDVTYPMWWRILPPDEATPTFVPWTVESDGDALAVALFGMGMAVLFVASGPMLARLQARPGRGLLAPPADMDLSLRIAQLSATRAAALNAHATELRRIERSLHDGAQNRLVAVTVLIGATRRALARDPAKAEGMLEQAQDAAEQALAELRTVVRSILPPVLEGRGLAGALSGLAADCAVPCEVDVDIPGRCAVSVEATAYFVTAEALTNIAKHSRARHASVTARRDADALTLRIEDDGVGGADGRGGTGLTGVRSRIEALDGRLAVTSPPGGPTIIEVELPCGL